MTTPSGRKSTTRSTSGRGRQQQRSTRSTTSKTTRSTTSESSTPAKTAKPAARPRGTRVDLPFVSAEFHRPDVHLPTTQDLSAAAQSVRSQLPSPGHALFYGGLALGAALSVIEWPVALAIGAGTALVSRNAPSTRSSASA